GGASRAATALLFVGGGGGGGGGPPPPPTPPPRSNHSPAFEDDEDDQEGGAGQGQGKGVCAGLGGEGVREGQADEDVDRDDRQGQRRDDGDLAQVIRAAQARRGRDRQERAVERGEGVLEGLDKAPGPPLDPLPGLVPPGRDRLDRRHR